MKNSPKRIFGTAIAFGTSLALAASVAMLAPVTALAAQLSSDGKASIPKDVQQIIVVDYRAMQNSPAAMNLKERILPPELKRLEAAMKSSGLKVDKDADVLAFAAFRSAGGDGTRIVGIAQGQFHTAELIANFVKQKTKPIMLRNNSIYPMGTAGMSVVFLNQTTMVFGDRDSVKASLDARDGLEPSFLANGDMVNEMGTVDSESSVEPVGPEGHSDDDEERAGRGRTTGRLRHGSKSHEELALHDGLPERCKVRHGGSDVGYHHGCYSGDVDEGCFADEEDLRHAAREDSVGLDDDRLERRHPDGVLRLF